MTGICLVFFPFHFHFLTRLAIIVDFFPALLFDQLIFFIILGSLARAETPQGAP
jgi:hypothetical protein